MTLQEHTINERVDLEWLIDITDRMSYILHLTKIFEHDAYLLDFLIID